MADNISTYRIEIKGTQEQVSKLTDIDIALKKLRAEKNKLEKEALSYANKVDTLNDQEKDLYTELKNKLSEISTEIRSNQNTRKSLNSTIENTNKLNTAQVGSYERLTAANSKLTSIMRKLNPNIADQRKQFDLITAKIKSNTDKLKGYDEQMGRFNRNVGNYAGDIKSVFSQYGVNFSKLEGIMALFKKAIVGVNASTNATTESQRVNTSVTTKQSNVQRIATATSNGLSKAMKILKIAIASTGIGLLVIAIASLVSYFKSTEEGATRLQKILAPFKILFGNIKDIAADLGERLVNIFSNPKDAVISLWNTIKTNIVNRITGIGDQFKAVGKIIKAALNLDFDTVKEGVAELGESTTQVLTGVDNVTVKVKENIKGFVDGVKKGVKETIDETEKLKQLEEDQLALQKLTRDTLIENAKREENIQRLRIQAKQEDKYTDEERLRFLNEALALEKENLDANLNIKEEEHRIAKEKADLSKSDAATLDDIAQKEAALYSERANYYSSIRRLESEKQTFLKENATQNAKLIEDENKQKAKLIEDEINSVKDASKGSIEEINKVYADANAYVKQNVKDKEEQDKLFLDLETSKQKDINNLLAKNEKERTSIIKLEAATQLQELAKSYLAKEINAEEYKKEKAEIAKFSQQQIFKAEVEGIQKRLEYGELAEVEKVELMEKLALKQVEIAEQQAKDLAEVLSEQVVTEDNTYLASFDNKLSGELALLKKKYKEGIIDAEEYKEGVENALSGISGVESWDNIKENIRNLTDSFKSGLIDIDTYSKNLIGQLESMWGDVELTAQYTKNAAGSVMDFIATKENNGLEKYNEIQNKKISKLDQRLESGLISEDQYNRQVAAITEKMDEKKLEIEIKQAKRQKALNVFQALISAPGVILNALKTEPFPLGLALSVLAGVMTGAQIANIITQPLPKLATGGIITEGSGRWNADDVPAWLSTGEAVINARVLGLNDKLSLEGTPLQIASSLNSYKGLGQKFAYGGLVTPNIQIPATVNTYATENMSKFVNDIVQGWNDKQVINNAGETAAVQRRINVINNAGDF